MTGLNYFVIVALLVFVSGIFAQSGRSLPAPTPTITADGKENAQNNKEKSLFIAAIGFENFLQELNRLGKAGYKLEKSTNSGGTDASQQFAGFLILNEGNSYQYSWIISPNKSFTEGRLNLKAQNGFEFVEAFALTSCGEMDSKIDSDSSNINPKLFDFTKGDVFLLVNKNNTANQTKEYKIITGKLGLGKNPTRILQAELDNSPPGFRPVKVLFNKTGLADFSISILLEKDFADQNPQKIEYKFVKEVNGFEKELNNLAGQGFRIVSGRRIGLVKMALMAKEETEPITYSIIDEEKYETDFNKTVSLGYVYRGILSGDADCDSGKKVNEKLFFQKNSESIKRDYKILKINSSENKSEEVKKLLSDSYRIKDFFYFKGLNIIFEK